MNTPTMSALLAALLVVGVLLAIVLVTRPKKSFDKMTIGELEDEIGSLEGRIRQIKSTPGYSEPVLTRIETRLNEASTQLMFARILARPEDPPQAALEQEQIDALRDLELRASALGQTPEEYTRAWVNEFRPRKEAFMRLGMSESEAAERAFAEAGTDAPFPGEKSS